MSGNVVKGCTEPVAVETIFGWTLSGSMNDITRNECIEPNQVLLAVEKRVKDKDLHELLKNFWDMESIGIIEKGSKEKDISKVLEKFQI